MVVEPQVVAAAAAAAAPHNGNVFGIGQKEEEEEEDLVVQLNRARKNFPARGKDPRSPVAYLVISGRARILIN